MNEIAAALGRFKLFVSTIQLDDDTIALDKDLAEAARLLYDTRHTIDNVWRSNRAAAQPKTKLDNLMDLIR